MTSIDLRTGRIYRNEYVPKDVVVTIPSSMAMRPWMNYLNVDIAHDLLDRLRKEGQDVFLARFAELLAEPFGVFMTNPSVVYIIGRVSNTTGFYRAILSTDEMNTELGAADWFTTYPLRLKHPPQDRHFQVRAAGRGWEVSQGGVSKNSGICLTAIASFFGGDVEMFDKIHDIDPEPSPAPIGGESIQHEITQRVRLNVKHLQTPRPFIPEDFRMTPLIASQGLASGVHPAFTRPIAPPPTKDRFQVMLDMRMAQTPEAKDRFRRLQRAILVAFNGVSVVSDPRVFHEIKMSVSVTRGPGLRKVTFKDDMVKTQYVLNATLTVRNLHDDALDVGLDDRFLRALEEFATSNP